MNTEEKKSGLALMREPFDEKHIGKLPRATDKNGTKGKCLPQSEGGQAPDWQDHFCGGYHKLPSIHLDFVGHAALTNRLLEADEKYTWEPFALDERGLPLFDKIGGLWIKLTVCGVTRPGYGIAEGKTGGDAMKEIIGDALRNAAMRFGAALDLWHKGELRSSNNSEEEPLSTENKVKDWIIGKAQTEVSKERLQEIKKALHSKNETESREYFETIKSELGIK